MDPPDDAHAFSQLIDSIYKAACGKRCWDQIAEAISRSCGYPAVGLLYQDNQLSVHWIGRYGINPSALENFACSLSGPESIERRYTRHQILWNHQQIHAGRLGFLFTEPNTQSRHTTGLSAVPFNEIRNHLFRSLDIYLRSGLTRLPIHAIQWFSDRLTQPVMLLNAAYDINHCNPAAEHLVQASGICRLINRKLCFESARLERIFYLNIRKAVVDQKLRRLRFAFPHHQKASIVYLHPLTPFQGAGESAFLPLVAVIALTPEIKLSLPDDLLRDSFGLTPAEIRIARHLLDGSNIRRIAQQDNVSVETVRSQLKTVLQKTMTRDQLSLMNLLIRHSLPFI
ncbi:MAG: helix-turn-helix transcriptional regulator [Ketobacteraceae bacterium]|nr:helix-turn-helix transcriptional regulator [Ketobacteraceae bacterium]